MKLQLPDLFRSKRFWSALLGLIFMVAVEFVPGLADNADQLINAALLIVGLVIGGYSLQDYASAKAGQNKYTPPSNES